MAPKQRRYTMLAIVAVLVVLCLFLYARARKAEAPLERLKAISERMKGNPFKKP